MSSILCAVLSLSSRGTHCSLRGSCRRITQTCSRRFAVAAPQTRLYATPLRLGPMRHHPRDCNGLIRLLVAKPRADLLAPGSGRPPRATRA